MKIIDGITQGTDAWLSWRSSKITATDASVCLDINP